MTLRSRHVIDRLEADLAVLEGLGAVPRALLPAEVHEGAVVQVEAGPEQVCIMLEAALGREAAQQVRDLQRSQHPLPGASLKLRPSSALPRRRGTGAARPVPG